MEQLCIASATTAADTGARPSAGPSFAVATTLRIHVLQRQFALSDPAMEEAPHDMPRYAAPSSAKNS